MASFLLQAHYPMLFKWSCHKGWFDRYQNQFRHTFSSVKVKNQKKLRRSNIFFLSDKYAAPTKLLTCVAPIPPAHVGGTNIMLL